MSSLQSPSLDPLARLRAFRARLEREAAYAVGRPFPNVYGEHLPERTFSHTTYALEGFTPVQVFVPNDNTVVRLYAGAETAAVDGAAYSPQAGGYGAIYRDGSAVESMPLNLARNWVDPGAVPTAYPASPVPLLDEYVLMESAGIHSYAVTFRLVTGVFDSVNPVATAAKVRNQRLWVSVES